MQQAGFTSLTTVDDKSLPAAAQHILLWGLDHTEKASQSILIILRFLTRACYIFSIRVLLNSGEQPATLATGDIVLGAWGPP